MSRKKQILLFCLIILLAAILRFTGICFDSLWLDESYQSLVGACGQGSPKLPLEQPEKFLFRFEKIAEIPEMLANFRKVDPLCPPLYAVSLNRWMSIFGQSDFVLRSLSALISTAAVAVVMTFAWLLFGLESALCTGLLLAFSPFDIHYAQEARMYSLLFLCATLSMGSLVIMVRSSLKTANSFLWLPLYVVSTWALINTHYTALFLALSQGLSATIYVLLKKNWKLLGYLICSWLLVAALWIPWLPLFFQSAASRKESFYVSRAADFIWPFKALFLRIPINWLVFMSGQRVFAYAAGIYATSALMLSVAAFPKLLNNNQKEFERMALWIWLLLPAVTLWIMDVMESHRVVEVARYLIYTAPAVFMLSGWGLSLLYQKKRIFYGVLVLHLLCAVINLSYTHNSKQREPWKEMAAKIEASVPADKLLVVSQHYDIVCLNRYLTKPRLQLGMSPAMGEKVIHEKLAGIKEFALLTAQDGESIKSMIPPYFKLKQQTDMPHGLHLRLYQADTHRSQCSEAGRGALRSEAGRGALRSETSNRAE